MSDEEKENTPPIEEEKETENPPEEEKDTPLGEAGQQALERMKVERREAKAEARKLREQLAELQKPKEDPEKPDLDAVRKAAREEALLESLGERALDKLEVRAAKLFADPDDARAMLAARSADFVDDGKIDTDAIDEALQDLLKRKPHLGAKPGTRFSGSSDGGARKGSKPEQLSREDLKRMTPAQIVKAQEDGRLSDLIKSD